MQRIGDLTATQPDIHAFGDQGGRFAVAAKGDIFQQDMRGGGKTVIHQVEIEFVIGVFGDPATHLSRAPAGLDKKIEGNDRNQQGDQNGDEQLSNKFHGLPSRKRT
jgi:hypothetical protein